MPMLTTRANDGHDVYRHFQKSNIQGLYFGEGTEPMLALESMIDAVGLRNVLFALKHVCEAKAEHIRDSWQDQTLAKAWERDARALELAARKIVVD